MFLKFGYGRVVILPLEKEVYSVNYQSVFKRYEIKYMIDRKQKERILEAMAPYMELDQYGRTEIRNIYFDTDSFRLIRHSIEKPAYKEKLRIRCYGKAKMGSSVFVELKKKYDHVVYKRRLSMMEKNAMKWMSGDRSYDNSCQIAREMAYFRDYYGTLRPAVFLSYEREAYRSLKDDDFRVTFDDNILCRQTGLSLTEEIYGEPILEEGKVLMEIKTTGGIPLWMTHLLTKEHIYKTSFSKYGTAYQKFILPKWKGEC